jgi:hypothetical protein
VLTALALYAPAAPGPATAAPADGEPPVGRRRLREIPVPLA